MARIDLKKALNAIGKHRILVALFGLLSLAVLCFIYSQSLLSGEESGGLSAKVMAFIRPILDPYGAVPEELFHHLLRKAAHFTEFMTLGICICGATVNYGVIKSRRFVALPMLLTLGAAVSDEFLQYFTGRGSMVTDVVIDYSGALFGIGLTALIAWLIGRRKQ